MTKQIFRETDEYTDDFVEELIASAASQSQYVISGSGWGWYLDPDCHEFVRVSRGTSILPLPSESEENKILVRTPYRFLLVPEEEVVEIGWN